MHRRRVAADVTLRWEAFLDHVKERGKYNSRQEAERAARVVLALLGAHLVGQVRVGLPHALSSCRRVGLGDVAPRRFPQEATTGRDPLAHPFGSTPRQRAEAPIAC
jgi:hypothetical protein